MSEHRLIYPWTAGELDAPSRLKSEVMQTLKEHYPGVYRMPSPEPRVVRAVSSIVRELLELEEQSKVPWMVCVTSSFQLLQTIARVVPVTVMLTRLHKPLNVTTNDLVEAFKTPAPTDDFSVDPAGEYLHRVRTWGILVWENFGELKLGGEKFASHFMSMLGHRMERKKMTVFLCAYSGTMTPKVMNELMERIQKSTGPNVPVMLREFAVWKHFKVAPGAFKFDSTEEV